MLNAKTIRLYKRMLDWEAQKWAELRQGSNKPCVANPQTIAQWDVECHAKFRRGRLTNEEKGEYEAFVFQQDIRQCRFNTGDKYAMYLSSGKLQTWTGKTLLRACSSKSTHKGARISVTAFDENGGCWKGNGQGENMIIVMRLLSLPAYGKTPVIQTFTGTGKSKESTGQPKQITTGTATHTGGT